MSADTPEACTDVVELCALLQCLGFSVKCLETNDCNISQEGGIRTVVIDCQTSGLHVVLEGGSCSCSCPATDPHGSGVWQVSGITGGKQLDKEFGSTMLGCLPKGHRERLSTELRNIIRYIRDNNESNLSISKDRPNRSASMVEIKTPEKKLYELKADTPTRYRSLDTLTSQKSELPQPLALSNMVASELNNNKIMCRRQSTYTVSSTPGSDSNRRRNKTSSPIQEAKTFPTHLLDHLLEVEKVAEDLRNKISSVVRDYVDDARLDSSMSSLALDVSKISVLKGSEGKNQFASSPNLSTLTTVREDVTKKLKRLDSCSTSNLPRKISAPGSDGKVPRLRRLSPNIFKSNKGSASVSKVSASESKTKLKSLFRPKIVTPVRIPRPTPEPSPSISATKKKFGHIKSTIPRPTSKKE